MPFVCVDHTANNKIEHLIDVNRISIDTYDFNLVVGGIEIENEFSHNFRLGLIPFCLE